MKLNAVLHGALRVLMLCGDGRVVRLAELAGDLGFPKVTVSHTCNLMVHAGILESRRGTGGGYRLARPPEDIRLLELFDIFDPEDQTNACGFRGSEECRICGVCRLRAATAAAYAAMRAELADLTVADFALDHASSVRPAAFRSAPG